MPGETRHPLPQIIESRCRALPDDVFYGTAPAKPRWPSDMAQALPAHHQASQ
jgi:hypothetical protein